MTGPEHLRAAERAHLDYGRLYEVRDGRVEMDQIALLLEASYHATMAVAKATAHAVASDFVEIEPCDGEIRDWVEVATS